MVRKQMITESNRTFEALKSLYITGFSSPWRKARPLAAPAAIFSLVNQGKAAEYPALFKKVKNIKIPSNWIKETV